MILTREKIKEEIGAGNIVIDPPLSDEQIGPGSVDLHLGNAFRRFKKQDAPLALNDGSSSDEVTELIVVSGEEPMIVEPGELVLGITTEKIKLADDLAGWIEGRSRFARLGLAVHVTSGFAQPGSNVQQVLEIVNLSHMPLALYPGTKICQFIFERCEGEAHYEGKFNAQANP